MEVGDILVTDFVAVVGVITGVVLVSVNGVLDSVSENEVKANSDEVVDDRTMDAEVCPVIVVDGAVAFCLNVVAELLPVSEALEGFVAMNVPGDDVDVRVGTSELCVNVTDWTPVVVRSDADSVFD